MKTMLQDCPHVQAAYEEFRRFSADPTMREQARERERFLIDLHLNRVYAMEEGLEKGRAEGRAQGTIETARNFKRLGVAPATIAEATGLSMSEIERLN